MNAEEMKRALAWILADRIGYFPRSSHWRLKARRLDVHERDNSHAAHFVVSSAEPATGRIDGNDNPIRGLVYI